MSSGTVLASTFYNGTVVISLQTAGTRYFADPGESTHTPSST